MVRPICCSNIAACIDQKVKLTEKQTKVPSSNMEIEPVEVFEFTQINDSDKFLE